MEQCEAFVRRLVRCDCDHACGGDLLFFGFDRVTTFFSMC